MLARFRNLKLAFCEGQIGWMPYLLERLDTLWRKQREIDKIVRGNAIALYGLPETLRP